MGYNWSYFVDGSNDDYNVRNSYTINYIIF